MKEKHDVLYSLKNRSQKHINFSPIQNKLSLICYFYFNHFCYDLKELPVCFLKIQITEFFKNFAFLQLKLHDKFYQIFEQLFQWKNDPPQTGADRWNWKN